MRLDQWLYEKGLAPSRSKAQELILSEKVSVKGQIQKLPSFKVGPGVEVEVLPSDVLRYVSRAGLKLEGAINHLRDKLELNKGPWLDIGQSTGGFTDCLLNFGAQQVFGIDVGEYQLSKKLKNHPQVISFEKLNAKEGDRVRQQLGEVFGCFEGVVIDVSFISMTLVLQTAIDALRPGGLLLSLVKPQFELSSGELSKKGIVKSPESYDNVRHKVLHSLESYPVHTLDYFESALPGKDGNREFFVFAKKDETL